MTAPADGPSTIALMAIVDAILEPYLDAPTLFEAERELDCLAGREDELPIC
jgi:hypothetical protein